jgi:hypothetical protein
MFAPHGVPGAALLSRLHTGSPVLHEVVLVEQLDGLHEAPWTQLTHAPEPLQTSFAPQVVPGASVVVPLHWGAPLEQSIWASMQGPPPEAQLAPWLQGTQLPLPSQTSPLPHEVPGDLFDEAMHAGALPPHSSTPSAQTLLDTHGAPCVQLAQPVASQTWPLPHVPQESVPSQPSGGVPQVSPSPWHVAFVHPHWFGVPAPPQASGAGHDPDPHMTMPPHPSLMTPQFRLPHVFGTHAPPPHVLGPPAPQD